LTVCIVRILRLAPLLPARPQKPRVNPRQRVRQARRYVLESASDSQPPSPFLGTTMKQFLSLLALGLSLTLSAVHAEDAAQTRKPRNKKK
jgi:hypothetical protein